MINCINDYMPILMDYGPSMRFIWLCGLTEVVRA